MSKQSKVAYFFISMIFFIIFDMYFSNLIIQSLCRMPENPVIDLIYVKNTGAAFSMLQDAKMFLICFSLAAILWIMFYTIRHIKRASGFAIFWTSILIAGIFCNMYERAVYGYVRDFFKLNFINFPVFNISDIFINLSVFAIVVIIIRHNFKKSNETGN